MGKHAYLILAFNNWNILNKCISIIDNERNDIFLLIDKKAKTFDSTLLYKCKHSRLNLVERINVFWADYSTVSAYLMLLSSAFEFERNNNLEYSYFHLQSGTCFPLKTQRYIHEFCDNSGKEFIGIVPHEFPYCINHTKVYWPFVDTVWFRKYKFFKLMCYGLAHAQRFLGVNRLKKCKELIYIYNGWANCSITHDFGSYLLQKKDLIYSLFHKTLASDELWIHTLAYNSSFRERIYDETNLRNGSMRYIDWERGRPYVWGTEDGDLELLLNSPYLFARKFDEKNMNIVDELCEAVRRMESNES